MTGTTLRRLVALGRAIVVAGCALSSFATVAASQQQISVTVLYVAGADIYIDVGRDGGLAPGDTLILFDDPDHEPLGRLVVRSSSSSRSVAVFADQPFSIARNDVLEVQVVSAPESNEPEAAAVPQSTPGSTGSRIDVRGRIAFDVNNLHSTREGSEVGTAPVTRDFTTPTGRLRLMATGFPAGIAFNVNARVSRRYSTGDILPVQSNRIYQASISRSVVGSPIQLELGRFYNRYATRSGFWDGLTARYGSEELGAGFAVGFEPSRSNEAFSADEPKVATFFNINRRGEVARYSANLSFNQTLASASNTRRTFAGWSQTFRTGGFSTRNDAQVDRNPVTGKWIVTRLSVGTTIPVVNRLSIRLQYSLQQPLTLANSSGGSYRRDVGRIGFTFAAPGAMFGGSVSASRRKGGDTGFTYSSSFNLSRLPLGGFGFGGSAIYRTQGTFRFLLLGPAITRSFGAVRTRAGYQFNRSQSEFASLVTHSVEFSMTFPLGRRLSSTARIRSNLGENLSSTNAYVGIWMAL